LATRLQKENCKGVDYFNDGEIKHKLLSWANQGKCALTATKCALSANDGHRQALFT
jgi:hypothetical protein